MCESIKSIVVSLQRPTTDKMLKIERKKVATSDTALKACCAAPSEMGKSSANIGAYRRAEARGVWRRRGRDG